MNKQLINDQKFTNIQKAQAGLTKLFEEAQKGGNFYTVLKNDQPLGFLIPNNIWKSFIEDLEALSSDNFKQKIHQARTSKKRINSDEVKRIVRM